jgi:hypothetical protein
MQHVLIQDPMADYGYPIDSDLHNMTDDGCPLFPDPARWADADSRGNLGELDTFDVPPGELAGDASPSRQVRGPSATPRSRLLRCRICGQTEACSPEELLLRNVPQAWPECCGRLMGYIAPQSPADVDVRHSPTA